jgi:tetratricopeptide (TPR) repeat protein
MRRALILLLVAARAAHADPAADKLFEDGQRAFQAADYTHAVALFKSAYELVRDPVYLFNIAQAYRKLLDCEQASDFYNRYLTDATDADRKQRDKVATWLRELQPCVEARQREHDEARRGAEALAQQQAEAERRRREAAIPRYAEVDRGARRRHAGLALAAGGGLLLAFGAYETVHGRSLRDEVAACATGCNWDDYAATDRAGHTANTLAAIGWLGGGALAAGGAVLYYLGMNRMERVQIAPAAGGATVSAHFTF